MNKSAIFLTIALGITALSGSVLAGGLDGATPAVCATTETFDCDAGRQCIADSPEAVNVPRLIRLDFAAKKAFTKKTSGEERTAEISSVSSQQGELLLQGVQNGFGWTMSISNDTGDMTLTIAGKGAGFIVFGSCAPL